MRSLAVENPRLYGDLAWTWPIIRPPEDYVGEAQEIVRLLRTHARGEPQTLLHLGCGGGHLDATLKRSLAVTGVDVSLSMLALAQRLNPEVDYVEGDMRTVRIGRTFDAVLIADSIDYMRTEEELLAAFRTGWEHLRPGGVLVTYAEHTLERFRQDETVTSTHEAKDVRITFIEHRHDPDPTDTTFDITFVWLISRAGGLKVESDRHVAGLFSMDAWRRCLSKAGFKVTEVAGFPEDSGESVPTFVGIRASEAKPL